MKMNVNLNAEIVIKILNLNKIDGGTKKRVKKILN
jgi:hypothetical protein